MFVALGRTLDRELDDIVPTLLKKSAEVSTAGAYRVCVCVCVCVCVRACTACWCLLTPLPSCTCLPAYLPTYLPTCVCAVCYCVLTAGCSPLRRA
jgi:hypothetical protein